MSLKISFLVVDSEKKKKNRLKWFVTCLETVGSAFVVILMYAT